MNKKFNGAGFIKDGRKYCFQNWGDDELEDRASMYINPCMSIIPAGIEVIEAIFSWDNMAVLLPTPQCIYTDRVAKDFNPMSLLDEEERDYEQKM